MIKTYLSIFAISLIYFFSSAYASEELINGSNSNTPSVQSQNIDTDEDQPSLSSLPPEIVIHILSLSEENTFDRKLFLVNKSWFELTTGFDFDDQHKKGPEHAPDFRIFSSIRTIVLNQKQAEKMYNIPSYILFNYITDCDNKGLYLYRKNISDLSRSNLMKYGLSINSELIDLQDLNIDDDKLTFYAEALAKSCIVNIYLNNNKITDQGVCDFLLVLAKNKNEKRINLSSNKITGKSLVALTHARFDSNHPLSDFQIVNNPLNSESIIEFTKIISIKSIFENITFCSNDIDDTGAIAIAKVVSNFKHNTCLNLRSNNITNKGANAIARAVSESDRFKQINLKDNQISDEGGKNLVEAFKFSKTLRVLNLEGNPVSRNIGQIYSK